MTIKAGSVDKIRVLTISKPYVAKTYRKKLVDLANEGRFEMGLVCPYQWGEQSFEGEAEKELKVWKLPISFNGKNHFHFYLGLEEVFKEFRPHIVNVEEEHYSIVTWQVVRLAMKYNAKPLFYTWQNISKKYPPPFSWIEQYVFGHCPVGVCGNVEASEILKAKGYKGLTPEIIQMGVDVERFDPKDYSEEHKRHLRKSLKLQAESFWISYFGRIVEEKGINLLVSAVSALKNAGHDVRCLVVGDGPYKQKIIELIHKENLTNVFTLKDNIPSIEVPQWLQSMDVLCLPSITKPNWKEQFGRILAEAMIAGTVTVGSSSGEIPKVIGKSGLVFAEGDAEALAGALKKLIVKPTFWKELQTSGAALARAKYADSVVAQKFAEVFASYI